MSDVRLIDADALEKLFEEECAGECPICSYSHEGCPCGFIRTVPTVEAYTKEDMNNEYLKGYLQGCQDTAKKGEELNKLQFRMPYGRGAKMKGEEE